MSNRRNWLVGFVAAVIAVGILAFILPPWHDNEGANSINLRLKWLWYSGWAGELVAEHESVWKVQNLTVNTRPGGFELDPIKLVASGEDQVGVAGADQVLLARMNGVPLVAFAVQYQRSPVGFAAMDASGIRTVAAFRGRRIGVKYGTDVEPVYRALLARAGLTKADVTEVPVKFDLAPFFSGAIDVYPGYLTNDLLIPQERGYKVTIISAPDEGLIVYGNVYFCRDDYLHGHAQQLSGFLAALREAWQRALAAAPTQVANLALAKNEGLDLKHEIRVAESLKAYVAPAGARFGEMSHEGWRHLYQVLREQGVIARDFDYRSAYTLSILDGLENVKR